MAAQCDRPKRGRLARGLLWFAALGGPLGWGVQLVAGWSTTEVACAAGHHRISGVPLRAALAVAVGVPGLVTVMALAVALWSWRRLARLTASLPANDDSARSLNRDRAIAAMTALLDLLFLVIVVLDGVNLAVFPPCPR